MPKEFSRTQRLSELMQRELATMIQFKVKDPRLKMVTVNDVVVTHDLAYAKVYVTVFSDDEAVIKENIDVLNHMAGFLRTQLGQKIKARTIPQLTFIFDKSSIEGNRIAKIISEVMASENKTKSDEQSSE